MVGHKIETKNNPMARCFEEYMRKSGETIKTYTRKVSSQNKKGMIMPAKERNADIGVCFN